jgi:hypothetical protein
MCLYQARKVGVHIFVCKGYQVCLFLRVFVIGFWKYSQGNMKDNVEYNSSLRLLPFVPQEDESLSKNDPIPSSLLDDLFLPAFPFFLSKSFSSDDAKMASTELIRQENVKQRRM